MQVKSLHTLFRVVSGVVLLLMAVGIVYAGVIGITYWTGIGV